MAWRRTMSKLMRRGGSASRATSNVVKSLVIIETKMSPQQISEALKRTKELKALIDATAK